MGQYSNKKMKTGLPDVIKILFLYFGIYPIYVTNRSTERLKTLFLSYHLLCDESIFYHFLILLITKRVRTCFPKRSLIKLVC